MRNDPAIPTLADVARHAKVSTATVSRCLNSPDLVQPPTRERVMTAVKALGYTPNFSAQALAAKRSNTIGAVIPTMDNAIFATGIQAFQEELDRHGMTLLIASSSYREDLEEQQIRNLVARGADGLLLIGQHRNPTIQRFLESRKTAMVTAWAYRPDDQDSGITVGFDNRKAMHSLASHVLALGHRNIGIISAPRSSNDRAHDRVSGIHDAMRDHGLNPNDATIIETNYSINNGGNALEQLMDTPTPPSVIMCGNDVLATGALRMAAAMKLSIPGDVSITGFDDIELARITTPELATVHVPHRQMGRLAAQTLISLVNGDADRKSVELETRLCLRGSLGRGPFER